MKGCWLPGLRLPHLGRHRRDPYRHQRPSRDPLATRVFACFSARPSFVLTLGTLERKNPI
ncbi:hypothetical protein E2C01_081816 [Portunus trituberculatus]|uniref:Uncharacterized protein n=1 Tax=Portunus trituberculatus TaxID=210409 RepID=A0A5B7INC7_PORTR|nr:hypothetical protein [Portunus trituberculatus]